MFLKTKHPEGLWILAAVNIFYDFAFGAITSLLVLYATQKLQMPTSKAYDLSAVLFSLLFILPLAGGYACEKLGYKMTGSMGFLTSLVGVCILVIPSPAMLYLGIACFVSGNALSTPTCYAMVGMHYDEHSPLRNSGYTLFYLLFNIGFFVSLVSTGFISELNFNLAFALGGICVLTALLIFILRFDRFAPVAGNSFAPQVSWSFSTRLLTLLGTVIFLSLISLILLHHRDLNTIVFFLLAAGTSLGLLCSALKQKDPVRRRKMLAFLILCIFSIAFWSLYILEPSLVAVFISQNVNRVILGLNIPAASYYALDPFFVITLGVFFTWLWQYLARKNKDPSLPTKFSASLLSMGLGYLIFAVGILCVSQHTYLVHSSWIVLGYLFLASAELLISPIGLSMVGQLMPKGREALGMGIWQVYVGFSGVIAAFLANLAVVPQSGLPQTTNPVFLQALLKIGLGTFVIGLLMCCLISKIRPLIQKN